MHPKWIAVIVFWGAVVLAVALPSSRAGDLVWFSIVLLAVIWTTVSLAVQAFRGGGSLEALKKAFFSGRGYPDWFLRFIGDDYGRPVVK